MKSKLIVLSLLAVLLTGLVSPSFAGHARAATVAAPVAGSVQTRPAFFDKTRFVVDLGIAYFCLHHVYKNYKRGVYAPHATARIRHIIAAGLVLAIAYDRLHRAYVIANESSSPTLHKIVAPLNSLLNKLRGQQGDFASGNFNDGAFKSMNSTADAVGGKATSNGFLFHDITVPLPGGA